MGYPNRPRRHNGRGVSDALYELAGQRGDLHGAVNPPDELLTAVIGTTSALFADRRVDGGSLPRAMLEKKVIIATERADRSRAAGAQFLTPDMVPTPWAVDQGQPPTVQLGTEPGIQA